MGMQSRSNNTDFLPFIESANPLNHNEEGLMMRQRKAGAVPTKALLLLFLSTLLLHFPSNAIGYQSDLMTRLPSDVAGTQGLALRVTVPSFARYSQAGAPIGVYMGGGFHSDCLSERGTELALHGFIEIRFNFQGGGTGETRSGGGPYDYRGPESLIAARDVLRFATGSLADSSGRFLAELTGSVVPLYTNVGLIGWSNGGNTNICVAGMYDDEIDGPAWIINWESPVGDGMPQAEAGSKECDLRPLNSLVNPAYNPNTGEWNLEKLVYDAQIQIPLLENVHDYVTGGLYFDFNSDGIVDPGQDFILYPLIFDMGSGNKAHYSERVRREAESQNLIPVNPPSHILTLPETEAFWDCRNGAYWIDSVLTKLPDVLFMAVANDTDHVQRTPDHPHVLLQYEMFRQGGARFVRLNPDRAYVEAFLGTPYPDAVDNDAFAPFNHQTIRDAVEPGNATDLMGYSIYAAAGACELADRSQFNDMSPQLDDVVTAVTSHSSVPEKFHVFQNFPNPFNSETTIPFEIYEANHVVLEIYNMLGRKVMILEDLYPPGTHRISVDARDLASGSYVYRVVAGENQKAGSMLLIK
jgi:hypothetical protein